jgi:hypothetical protein
MSQFEENISSGHYRQVLAARARNTLTIPEDHVKDAIEVSLPNELHEFYQCECGYACGAECTSSGSLFPYASTGEQ